MIFQVRNDADKVIDTMFMLMSYSDCIYKKMMLRIKADKIEAILETMKGGLFTYCVITVVNFGNSC